MAPLSSSSLCLPTVCLSSYPVSLPLLVFLPVSSQAETGIAFKLRHIPRLDQCQPKDGTLALLMPMQRETLSGPPHQQKSIAP